MSLSPTLEAAFNRMEAARTGLYKLLEGLPEEKLAEPPREGAWSVFQILNHLMMTERGFAMYLMKKLPKAEEAGKPSPLAPLKLAVVKAAFQLGLKRKAPELFAQPENAKTLAESKAAYEQARQFLYMALSNLPEEHLNKGLLKHPVVGRMSVPIALDFMLTHFDKHRKQIQRNRRQLGIA